MAPRRNFRRKALKILSKVRPIPSTLKKMTISSPLVISVYNNIQVIFINSPSSMQIIDSLRHFPNLITRDQTTSTIGKEKQFFFLIQMHYIGWIDEKRTMTLQETRLLLENLLQTRRKFQPIRLGIENNTMGSWGRFEIVNLFKGYWN